MAWLTDAAGLDRLCEALAAQIVAGRRRESKIALVGVRTRGLPIAERIARHLSEKLGENVPIGAVDTTLYRDDLEHAGRWPKLHGTDVPFDVEDAEIVLVDDVLNTGRSGRAALNIVCDLGRPACVRLAVVVDRGGRELPIQADYVGLRVEAIPEERIVVRIEPIDEVRGIERVSDSA